MSKNWGGGGVGGGGGGGGGGEGFGRHLVSMIIYWALYRSLRFVKRLETQKPLISDADRIEKA